MQQTVQRINSVKRCQGKIQIEKIHLISGQSLLFAETHHLRRKIGTNDLQAVILKKLAISAGAGTNLQQTQFALLSQQREKMLSLCHFPGSDFALIPLLHSIFMTIRILQLCNDVIIHTSCLIPSCFKSDGNKLFLL
jgi:hypothetical protein